MEIDRLLHMFGLARRSGRLQRGFDAAAEVLHAKTAVAVYLANDAAERTVRNIRRIAAEAECPCEVFTLPVDMATLGHAIGCKPTAVLALTDSGFATAIRKLLPAQDDTEE